MINMIVYEMKLQGTESQYRRLDEAIRTGRFVRNSIIKAWIDGHRYTALKRQCLR